MSTEPPTRRAPRPRGALYAQLRWFIRLRWVVVAALALGAAFEHHMGWFGGKHPQFLSVAVIVLGYNAAINAALERVRRRRTLRALAVEQLVLDMIALTALVAWTGGVRSPLIAFFVFHMVFASMLLARRAAYACAAAAAAFMLGGLALAGQWPRDRAGLLTLAGVIVTLGLTVMLTNHIMRDLRAQRRQLLRQNRRVGAMSDQLRQQQQALVQHEKMVAMGRMAAGVTHEIANPLASMDSLLQLAQRRPERLKPEMVRTLRAQVQRINQIIQQMKSFAHPAESHAQIASLNTVVEQSLDMLGFDARLGRVQVRREFDPADPVVEMSPQALQQVLVNLIINALDAVAANDQPVLTLRTQRREGCCVVEVADNGHGVDPQHLPRLFEPFFTTKPLGKGTGLGLSISYSLMQRQGGSISVRSQSGQGATFTLRLPTRDAADSPHARNDRSRPQEAPTPAIGGGENETA